MKDEDGRQMMSFEEIVAIEPGLAAIASDVGTAGRVDGEPFCRDDYWYSAGGPKARLKTLAGWYSRNPTLRTTGCYDVAYETLRAMLPDCHDSDCNA